MLKRSLMSLVDVDSALFEQLVDDDIILFDCPRASSPTTAWPCTRPGPDGRASRLRQEAAARWSRDGPIDTVERPCWQEVTYLLACLREPRVRLPEQICAGEPVAGANSGAVRLLRGDWRVGATAGRVCRCRFGATAGRRIGGLYC